MRTNYLFKFGFVCSLLLGGAMAHAENHVLCIPTNYVLVYQQDIKTIAFSGEKFESLALFKGSWGINDKSVSIGGKYQKFVRVQFLDREEEDADNDIGWVKEEYVKPQSKCPGYVAPKIDDNSKGDDHEDIGILDAGSNISGLNDVSCCRFPLASSAQADYTTGMRRFGFTRSGGARKHAAADLYHRQFEPVYAVADGVVLRDRESFYGGTAATEIKHTGGFVVRYGEIAFNAQKRISGINTGSRVKAGQLIGYMKATKKSRGFNHPMLHFELYSGKVTGDLTQASSKLGYKRRSDLLNPTRYLQKWEGNKG